MNETRPLPEVSTVSRPYWEGAREGKLMLPVCDTCDNTWFPPTTTCPRCLAPTVSWKQASGRGTLWSWNVFHRAYFPGFRDALPYLTVLVKLDEGPLITSSLVDADPADLVCDLPVVVEFQTVTDEITLPVFRVVSGSDHSLSNSADVLSDSARKYDGHTKEVSGNAL